MSELRGLLRPQPCADREEELPLSALLAAMQDEDASQTDGAEDGAGCMMGG